MLTPPSRRMGGDMLHADTARCPGVYAEGWREGCEDCQRRTPARGDRVVMMEPPPIIVDECDYRIPPEDM